jgi:nucleoside-diphosphate-sugar epimerase
MWIVTGGSGFVGGHALRELGGGARALTRRDWAALPSALAGATGVVHAASVVHRPDTPREEYLRFNVEGTRQLLDAARASGVRRFVFVSSIKVHGEAPAGVIDETTPVASELDYGRSKAQAEQLVLAARDLQPVVLRLCPVYGRGDKGNVRTMIRAIWRRRFLIPGDGAARKSIVHASTVAQVIRAALSSTQTGAFVVADRQTPTIRELSQVIAHGLGRRSPLAVPRPVLRTAAAIAGGAARRLGIATAVSAELIDKATADSVCDPARTERDLGVDCHVDLEWAIRDEIQWLRETSAL